MHTYTHLFLDADETIFDFKETEKRSLACVFSSFQISASVANKRAYHEANDHLWADFEKGLITIPELNEERFRVFFAQLGIAGHQKAAALYEEALGRNGILLPGAYDFLTTLKERGYHLHLITNGIATVQRKRLAGTKTEDFFEKVFISEELGVQKPENRFFAIALTEAGAEKQDSLVIGDRISSDIKGGHDYGIDTLYLKWNNEEESADATYTCDSYEEALFLLNRQ